MELNKRNLIHSCIVIALMLLFGLLPAVEPLTQEGMHILGIFIGCIYAWTFVDTTWPSLLALICLGFVGENTIASVFSAAYGNQNIYMVLITFTFCYSISKSGLVEYVARRMLTLKIAQKGPWALYMILCFTALITTSLVINSLPVVVLLWSIFYQIAEQLGLQKRSPYVAITLISIGICAYLGYVLWPFNPFALICFGVLEAVMPGVTINYVSYIFLNVILDVIIIVAMTLFFKFIVKPEVAYKSITEIVRAEDLKLPKQAKQSIVYLLVICAALILPNVLPAEWLVTQFLNKLGFLGTFSVIVVAQVLTVKEVDSDRSLMDIVKAMSEGVPWSMIFLLATALAISTQLTADYTGIPVLLKMILDPLLAGKSTVAFMIIMVIVGGILTNCINNIVTLTLLTPIAVGYLGNDAGSIALIASLFVMMLLQGVVMPAGSLMGAMLHGNTSWLSSKLVYKYATLAELVVIMIIAFFGVGVGSLIFR